MPRTYDHMGIRFQYPDNWQLEESGESETPDAAERQSVSVSSPGGAFWTLVEYPPSLQPEVSVETSLSTMRELYPDLDAEVAADEIAGHRLRGYDLNFICLDLTNTTEIRGFRTATASYLLLCQADDREFEKVQLVFRAITTSLLTGLTPNKSATWPPQKR